MAWLRQSRKATQAPDTHLVEQRLAEIVETQSELNRNTQEIKDITAEIVKTLNSGAANDVLAKLGPALEIIPSLAQEMATNIKSIEAQFTALHRSQLNVQNDVLRAISLITDLTAQLLRMP